MKYRKLGRTGFEVSDVAHGLWGMSGWSGSDDRESLASMQLAIDLGCNFFDTAWAYGDGKSDGLLGETMARNSGKRIYAASKIPPANGQWPALPEYKYRDVFSAEHVFKYADMIRKQLRVDTIDLLQFHVWDDTWTDETGVSIDGRETEARQLDSLFRIEHQSLAAGERDQGTANRAGGCGAGDLQHFRSGAGGRAFPALSGAEYGRDRPRAARRRQPGRQDDAGNDVSQRDWRAGYFGPENLRRRSSEWTAEGNCSGRDDSAGDGAALHSVPSGGEHDDRRDAKSGTRAANVAHSDAGPLD